MERGLGKTMLIANPTARSGRGAKRIEEARGLLRELLPAGSLDVRLTSRPHHAEELAAGAQGYDSVVLVGGDGLVNEAANGLMALAASERPALGVIPAGSGNDYAKALGMSTDVARACRQLVEGTVRPVDVGLVNGRWFLETLSFGLDAAIALRTMELRTRKVRHGTLLYLESGLDQVLRHLRSWNYAATFDGGAPMYGESITFAVQIGPYYGGGFKICPDASLDDGAFSLCIAHPPATPLRALVIFLCAKKGHHVRFRQMEFLQARTLRVEFDEAPPAQVDGEPLSARTFDIAMEPRALNVIRP